VPAALRCERCGTELGDDAMLKSAVIVAVLLLAMALGACNPSSTRRRTGAETTTGVTATKTPSNPTSASPSPSSESSSGGPSPTQSDVSVSAGTDHKRHTYDRSRAAGIGLDALPTAKGGQKVGPVLGLVAYDAGPWPVPIGEQEIGLIFEAKHVDKKPVDLQILISGGNAGDFRLWECLGQVCHPEIQPAAIPVGPSGYFCAKQECYFLIRFAPSSTPGPKTAWLEIGSRHWLLKGVAGPPWQVPRKAPTSSRPVPTTTPRTPSSAPPTSSTSPATTTTSVPDATTTQPLGRTPERSPVTASQRSKQRTEP
jgi:hypothetical protein